MKHSLSRNFPHLRVQNFVIIALALATFSAVLGLSLRSFAAKDEMEVESSEEVSVRKVARGRLYAGGADEESLKVQEQLPTIKKEGDNEAEPPEPADAD